MRKEILYFLKNNKIKFNMKYVFLSIGMAFLFILGCKSCQNATTTVSTKVETIDKVAPFSKIPEAILEKAIENEEVQAFLEVFDEEKFLVQIEENRAEYEELVKRIKKKDQADEELKVLYRNTRKAYNQVLDEYIEDIQGIDNIIVFELFMPKVNYKHDIEEAKKLGDQFLIMGHKLLSGETAFSPSIKAWIMKKLWASIQFVHNEYLEYVKLKMEYRIEKAKFKPWDLINV